MNSFPKAPLRMGRATIEYRPSEYIRDKVQAVLGEFLFSSNDLATLRRMEGALVYLFRTLYSQGVILDEVDATQVEMFLRIEGGVGPANIYTEALLNGCVRVADDCRNSYPPEPVIRKTRYDLARGV